MTEIPEHLLKRSRDRRAALGLGGGQEGEAAAAEGTEAVGEGLDAVGIGLGIGEYPEQPWKGRERQIMPHAEAAGADRAAMG